MKRKIIKWFQDILGITELKEKLIECDRQMAVIALKNVGLKMELKELKSTLDVGVDYHSVRSPSWAIVCVNGKADYIKLFTFNPGYADEIKRFLKNFEPQNITIDRPMGLPKDIFIRK
ncbi:hypothetical protein [Dyadobacter sp. CY312]|uniref:hypothetical protein n=1 Tax=Dyadobacter sp. CY312 TaxID=2907303 RepID=UPI001F40840F|nr:hypothetical protein [Dyadobacter sp. CY312]MCE7039260.1 hypothetical protein [Dyadobacter sp. CY312]